MLKENNSLLKGKIIKTNLKMKITPEASAELEKILRESEKEGAGIRIFSTRGCCGPSIQMDIVPQPGSEDTIITIGNIDFFIEKSLVSTLSSVTLDYGINGFKLNGLVSPGKCCN
ncbi:MAG: iron-sulfur cluster biosynthesis family protein [Bacteroidales bacterium]